MKILAPGQKWSSPASFRQVDFLERLQRDIDLLKISPSPALKDLYSAIGKDGTDKAFLAVEDAKLSAGRASAILDIYFRRSLTATIKYLLDGELNEQD